MGRASHGRRSRQSRSGNSSWRSWASLLSALYLSTSGAWSQRARTRKLRARGKASARWNRRWIGAPGDRRPEIHISNSFYQNQSPPREIGHCRPNHHQAGLPPSQPARCHIAWYQVASQTEPRSRPSAGNGECRRLVYRASNGQRPDCRRASFRGAVRNPKEQTR